MKTRKAELEARVAGEVRLTPFRRKVYLALLEVPEGCVTTYGLLARRVGCGCARAVGGALRANPFAPDVPCHRVLASDLSPGGFCGARSGAPVGRKLSLLRGEGVPLDGAGRWVGEPRVWRFPKGPQ